jgi:hypothetical protein
MTLSTNIQLYKTGWWVSVSPLARTEPECWVCSVYRKGKISWITEVCKDFNDPESAYEWGWSRARELGRELNKK